MLVDPQRDPELGPGCGFTLCVFLWIALALALFWGILRGLQAIGYHPN